MWGISLVRWSGHLPIREPESFDAHSLSIGSPDL